MKKTILPFFIPFQGCPYTCTYCDQNTITGAPAQSISSDIETFFLQHKSEYDEVEVGFFGGTFTCLPKENQIDYFSQVTTFLHEKAISRIRCSTRPDAFSAFEPTMYHSFGCTHFELGVQSFSDSRLRFLGRNYSADTVKNACSLLRENGFTYGLQLMCGFPDETDEEFQHDIERMIELQPEDCRIYPLVLLEGTALARQFERERWRFPSLEQMVDRVARAAFRIESAGITILRMGLAHSEKLADSVVAGTYHPSFADLVRRRQLEISIAVAEKRTAYIAAHPKDIEYVRSMVKNDDISVVADELMQRGCIKYIPKVS